MGVVMLDADFLRNVCIEGVFCGQVFGVQVVGDGLWIDIEEALVMFNALAERGQGLQILQVSDRVGPILLQAGPRDRKLSAIQLGKFLLHGEALVAHCSGHKPDESHRRGEHRDQ